jgi:hypothetical protein
MTSDDPAFPERRSLFVIFLMAAAVSTANAAIVPVQIYWRRPIYSFSV